MKRSLALAQLVLFVLTASVSSAQVDAITILHFNDTHSTLAPIGPRNANLEGSLGGIARAATLVQMSRQLDPNVLLLHAGDVSIGDVFYNTTFGVAELQMMLAMGLDAMTLGNHEFDLTPATLLQALATAFADGSFPLLSANLVVEDSTVCALKNFVYPCTIKRFGKTTVGIFGLTTPATNLLSSPSPAFVDTNIVEIASAMVDTLTSRGCDVIICLSHLGVMLDQAIASSVPGIQVIVGGHDHYSLETPIVVTNPARKQTLIVQANAFYLDMGKMQLAVSGGQVRLLNYRLIPIDDQIPQNPEIAGAVQQLVVSVESTYGPLFSQQIGFGTETLEEVADSLGVVGKKDTPIGNLVTDAFLAATHTDFALEVGGSTAAPLSKGPIVADDVFRVLGYGFNTDNGLGYRLATFRMTGEDLLAGLQYGLTKSAEEENDEFLAQVSGMSYEYTCSHVLAGKTYGLTTVKVRGVPLELHKLYTVTANEFVPMFLDVLGIPYQDPHIFTDTTEFQVVAAYIARLGTIRPIVEGRVRCTLVTSVGERTSTIPVRFSLEQNYPNPFNPSTTIAFDIGRQGTATLVVYNVIGQRVATLIDEHVNPGSYKITFDASRLSSGIYFYTLRSGDFMQSKKMLLLK